MISTYGDWNKCGMLLKALSVKLMPVASAKLYEDGKIVVEKVQGHIDSQDLPWSALADTTIKLKQDETIYLETGYLRDNIGIRKVKSSKQDVSYFVGASPWKTHPESGEKLSDIMMYMEYGTATQPPRPLIAPTYDEVRDKLQKEWRDYMQDIVSGGVL